MGASTGHDAPSIMFYCHDAYGLGHLRRALTLGHYLQGRWPGMAQLIVTGSPLPHHFVLPENADYIKLPSVLRIGPEQDEDPYVSRALPISFSQIRDLRRDILLSILHHFQPDALVVDVMPAGVKGDLVPALRYLRDGGHHTRLILGMRDMVDDPPLVRHAYARDGVYDLLDNVYDLILVYGQQDVFDVAREYGFSPRAAAKTRYVGYLRRHLGARSAAHTRADLELQTGRLVLVTAGGGIDGYPVLRAMLDAIRLWPEAIRFDCVLVSGPLMPGPHRQTLKELVPAGTPVRFLDFVEDLTSYIAAADVVVSMAGYNSICEILSFARPAIIIPRVARPTEQLLRAEALSRRGIVRMIHPENLTPGHLLEHVNYMLEHPTSLHVSLDLDGLPAFAAELETLLRRSTS